jgi:NH3-dependent NAD+ synthetase
MGAASSILIEGNAPKEGITEEEKVALAEITNLLKAYNITTKEDIQAVNEKLNDLQAEGVHGLALLQEMHKAMHKIANKEGLEAADAMAEAVLKARERVRILMKQVAKENFVNYMVGFDGSRGSQMAYEVCVQELIKSKDGMIVAHVFDSTKKDDNLDAGYKPESLKEKIDIDLTARSNMGRYKLMWWNKRGEKTAPFMMNTVSVFFCVHKRFVIIYLFIYYYYYYLLLCSKFILLYVFMF